MSVNVVDLHEEVKEEPPALEPIEAVNEEPQQTEILNDVVEEVNE